ncbi:MULTISPECIES: HofO family protein [Erwinia]|uniref:HofO family protein n=1 Tax=Erwinia TaxID=551 RepID=UPI001489E2BA|nr:MULTISPECIES: hypothetical protein [Erwinia]MCS3608803.1 pilus assembly protein HofO [Erwinia rhapontici]NNS09626.1 hypothetical protein [Erwinia sp. JH02]
MMHRWLIGWLQMPAWIRLGSFCGAALLLAMLLWGAWLHPIKQKQQQGEQQWQQLAHRYRQQLQLLRAMPALATVQQQTEQIEARLTSDVIRPFLLPDLLKASGAVLEYWHPAGQGGELSLMLNWPQFIALLDYLSALQPTLLFSQFKLQREEQQLRLVMELTDEN